MWSKSLKTFFSETIQPDDFLLLLRLWPQDNPLASEEGSEFDI